MLGVRDGPNGRSLLKNFDLNFQLFCEYFSIVDSCLRVINVYISLHFFAHRLYFWMQYQSYFGKFLSQFQYRSRLLYSKLKHNIIRLLIQGKSSDSEAMCISQIPTYRDANNSTPVFLSYLYIIFFIASFILFSFSFSCSGIL